MPSFKGHFDGTAVVLDEPAGLVVGQSVRVEVVEPASAVEQPAPPRSSRFGFAKGTIQMSDDFNEPLEDFAEYM